MFSEIEDILLEREISERLCETDEDVYRLVARMLDKAERDAGHPSLFCRNSRWAGIHYDIHFEQKMWV